MLVEFTNSRHKVNILLLVICAIKKDILTGHVTARHVFVLVLTKLCGRLRIPCGLFIYL